MSPVSFTPARMDCSTCPDSENATFAYKGSLAPPAYRSGSVGRTLGRRSLDAFSFVRESLKGRRALHPTINQKLAISTSNAVVGNGPLEPSTKQDWYDSLRRKSSQIPTPSSPAPMSSTLKRPRCFWSSPTRTSASDLLPSLALRKQPQRPLPELKIASLQSELQQTTIFGDVAMKSSVETELKPKSRKSTPKIAIRTKTELPTEARLSPQAQVAPVTPTAGAGSISPEPATSAKKKSMDEPEFTVASASATADKKTLDPRPASCDLYYKGTAWQPEFKKGFSDATSALSHFALRHMLTEKRDCSNTLLWTSEIQMKNLQVHQTFTVYPLTDGPKRTEIQKNYNFHWAIIIFTDDSSSTKMKTHLGKEDERLTMAIRNVASMGYHVEIWTKLDDDGWDMDLLLAEAELARNTTKEKHKRSPSRGLSVFFNTQHLERRKRYEVFAQHGVAGFLQADLDLVEHLQSGDLHPKRLGWNHLQNGGTLELMGFLEHTEENIVEAD